MFRGFEMWSMLKGWLAVYFWMILAALLLRDINSCFNGSYLCGRFDYVTMAAIYGALGSLVGYAVFRERKDKR